MNIIWGRAKLTRKTPHLLAVDDDLGGVVLQQRELVQRGHAERVLVVRQVRRLQHVLALVVEEEENITEEVELTVEELKHAYDLTTEEVSKIWSDHREKNERQ